MEGAPVRSALVGAAALVLLALPTLAGETEDRNPKNDPETCPYCHGDSEVMARCCCGAHCGFGLGRTQSGGVQSLLSLLRLRRI